MGAAFHALSGMHVWPFNHACSARHHRFRGSLERVAQVLERVESVEADRLAIRELIDARLSLNERRARGGRGVAELNQAASCSVRANTAAGTHHQSQLPRRHEFSLRRSRLLLLPSFALPTKRAAG